MLMRLSALKVRFAATLAMSTRPEPAIFRDERIRGQSRPGRNGHRVPVDLDGSASGGRAEQAARDIGLAGADQAGEPDHFAAMDVDGDVTEDATAREPLVRSSSSPRVLLLHCSERAPTISDDGVVIGWRADARRQAIAHHRYAVGETEYLLHPMRNEDAKTAAFHRGPAHQAVGFAKLSDAVGSSRMSTLDWNASARPISTSCCWPVDRLSTRVSTGT